MSDFLMSDVLQSERFQDSNTFLYDEIRFNAIFK